MTQRTDQAEDTVGTCILPMLGLTLLVMGLGAWILWAWTEGHVPAWLVFIVHIISCLSFLGLAYGYRRLGRSWRLAVVAFPIVLVLGPIGALGMFLTTILYAWYRKRATPFEVWYREILPEQITPPEERLIERLLVWGEETEIQHQQPMPFADVLAAGSRSEKQSAITLMLRNYHPSFAPAFREALSDSDNAVRVQAASAITRIEENFLADNLLLERRRASHPNDVKNLAKLAKHYDEHASSGLSDEETLAARRQKAELAYQQLHELKPDDAIVLWSFGRLLIRSERYNEAAKIFEKALDLSVDAVDPLQRVWYWECLYNQARYAELRQQVRTHYEQIPKDTVLPQALLDSIDLWLADDIHAELVSA